MCEGAVVSMSVKFKFFVPPFIPLHVQRFHKPPRLYAWEYKKQYCAKLMLKITHVRLDLCTERDEDECCS